MNIFNELTANINVYDIYGICYPPASALKSIFVQLYSTSNMGLAKVGNTIKAFKKVYTIKDYTPFLFNHLRSHSNMKSLRELPPCLFGTPFIEYLNNEQVRSQLHIPTQI